MCNEKKNYLCYIGTEYTRLYVDKILMFQLTYAYVQLNLNYRTGSMEDIQWKNLQHSGNTV